MFHGQFVPNPRREGAFPNPWTFLNNGRFLGNNLGDWILLGYGLQADPFQIATHILHSPDIRIKDGENGSIYGRGTAILSPYITFSGNVMYDSPNKRYIIEFEGPNFLFWREKLTKRLIIYCNADSAEYGTYRNGSTMTWIGGLHTSRPGSVRYEMKTLGGRLNWTWHGPWSEITTVEMFKKRREAESYDRLMNCWKKCRRGGPDTYSNGLFGLDLRKAGSISDKLVPDDGNMEDVGTFGNSSAIIATALRAFAYEGPWSKSISSLNYN